MLRNHICLLQHLQSARNISAQFIYTDSKSTEANCDNKLYPFQIGIVCPETKLIEKRFEESEKWLKFVNN